MAKVTLKESKTDQGGQAIDLTLKQLTPGELLAIVNALGAHKTAVGDDVLAYIHNAKWGFKNPVFISMVQEACSK